MAVGSVSGSGILAWTRRIGIAARCSRCRTGPAHWIAAAGNRTVTQDERSQEAAQHGVLQQRFGPEVPASLRIVGVLRRQVPEMPEASRQAGRRVERVAMPIKLGEVLETLRSVPGTGAPSLA